MHADNPDAIAPAGKVHCTLADWAQFLAAHLDPALAETTLGLSAKTLAELHQPVDGAKHAAGWIVVRRGWAGGDGLALTHSGSNTMNYCTVWLAPARRLAVLAVCNACPTEGVAHAAVDASIADMIRCEGRSRAVETEADRTVSFRRLTASASEATTRARSFFGSVVASARDRHRAVIARSRPRTLVDVSAESETKQT